MLVLGLAAGDYLVWNWSLSGNHDVPALVSGLTLPPLVAASVLLLATTALRLLARSTRRVGVKVVSVYPPNTHIPPLIVTVIASERAIGEPVVVVHAIVF